MVPQKGIAVRGIGYVDVGQEMPKRNTEELFGNSEIPRPPVAPCLVLQPGCQLRKLNAEMLVCLTTGRVNLVRIQIIHLHVLGVTRGVLH